MDNVISFQDFKIKRKTRKFVEALEFIKVQIVGETEECSHWRQQLDVFLAAVQNQKPAVINVLLQASDALDAHKKEPSNSKLHAAAVSKVAKVVSKVYPASRPEQVSDFARELFSVLTSENDIDADRGADTW